MAFSLISIGLWPHCVGAQSIPVSAPSGAAIIAASVTEAAQRFGLPENWIYAVMRVESAGAAQATSPKGAMGLMQIMPATWARLRARFGLGANAYDAHDNILGGTAYLRLLYDQYGMPGALAAYNAGAGRYSDFLLKGRVLPSETRNYVAKIVPLMTVSSSSPRMAIATPSAAPQHISWTNATLFAHQSARTEYAAIPQAQRNVQSGRRDTEETILAPSQSIRDRLFVALSGPSAR